MVVTQNFRINMDEVLRKDNIRDKKYSGVSIKAIAKSWGILVQISFLEIWLFCNPITLLFVIFSAKILIQKYIIKELNLETVIQLIEIYTLIDKKISTHK